MVDNESYFLQLEIYLLEFIDLYCIKSSKETCLISEFKNRFQDYTGIVYEGVTIPKFMINKLKYSQTIVNCSRHFKGLSLKN